MPLDSVGNVLSTVLRRSDGDSMLVSSLHPFAVRLYFEHLLPANHLATTDLPPELANPTSLVKYLREWNSDLITIEGAEGEYVARWNASAVPGSAQTQQAPDSSETANAAGVVHEGASNGYDSTLDAPPLTDYARAVNVGEAQQNVESSYESLAQQEAEQQEVTSVRQLMCSTLLDYVLRREGATHYNTATSLEDARLRCIQLLVKGFPDAPPELISEEGLEDLLLSQPKNFMITLYPGRRKMVFKIPLPFPSTPLDSDSYPAPNPPHSQGPQNLQSLAPTPVYSPYDPSTNTIHSNVTSLLSPGTPSPTQLKSPSLAPTLSNMSIKNAAVAKASHASPQNATQAAATNPRMFNRPLLSHSALSGGFEATQREKALAYLSKHKAFDGPQSVLVDKVRLSLISENGGSHGGSSSPLFSLDSFRELLDTIPGVTAWVAKKSDTLRCMYDISAPARTTSFTVPTATPPTRQAVSWHDLLPRTNTFYKAVQVYLVSQNPQATTPATAVKVHILLKAVRSSCYNTEWKSHPALISIVNFMKFTKQDTSLLWVDAGDGKDSASVYIKPAHLSCKAALKMVADSALEPADGAASSSQASSGNLQPRNMSSGYPQLGTTIETWGPTSDVTVLRTFLQKYKLTKTWGFDCKAFATPVAANPDAPSNITVVTLATCRASLVWDVSSGGTPDELKSWFEDSTILKSRISAKGTVNMLANSLDMHPAGFLDLRELFKLGTPKAVAESAFSSFPSIAVQVLGIKIPGNTTVMKSNWAHRPLSTVQQKYTVQNAWLHAHLLQSLSSTVGWDEINKLAISS